MDTEETMHQHFPNREREWGSKEEMVPNFVRFTAQDENLSLTPFPHLITYTIYYDTLAM